MVENADGQAALAELLYPFYLDVDMSMAFAAAVAGGVALEEELVDRSAQTTEAVKKLQGSLRLWRAGGFEAGRAATESSDIGSESRVIRRHSEASLFIVLYDELRRTGQLRQDPGIEAVRVSDIVSAQLGPAIAPLRRVLDQVIRLLGLLAPIVGAEEAQQESSPASASRATRRQASRSGGHSAAGGRTDDEQGTSVLQNLRRLFGALREDLEQSGLIDIIVSREEKPSVLLTLDRRFVSPPALELLHTSQFTVVGKVTQLWAEDGAVVNPYRLSAMSLVPSLSQSIAWAPRPSGSSAGRHDRPRRPCVLFGAVARPAVTAGLFGDGELKNLIFAADGPKHRIVLWDAINRAEDRHAPAASAH